MAKILQYIFLIESSVCILMGILGLVCLLQGLDKKPSDRILAHLTVCNIFSVVMSIIFEHDMEKATHYIGGVVRGIYILYALILIIIMIDRILAVSLILRYRVMVSNKRLTIALLCAWVLSFLFGMSYHLFKSSLFDYVLFSLSAIVVLFFIASYTYIIIKIRIKRKVLLNTGHRSKESSINYWVPFIIILSYILFQVAVDLSVAFSGLHPTTWHYILWNINSVVDTLTYILGSSRVRSNMREILTKIRCKKDRMEEYQHGCDTQHLDSHLEGVRVECLINRNEGQHPQI